jgi:hypothetical protein
MSEPTNDETPVSEPENVTPVPLPDDETPEPEDVTPVPLPDDETPMPDEDSNMPPISAGGIAVAKPRPV